MTLPEKPEPSVLDYIKGKILPGKNPAIEIPGQPEIPQHKAPSAGETKAERTKLLNVNRSFWFMIFALTMLLIGQSLLEPPYRSVIMALVFYGCGLFWVVYRWFNRDFEVDLYPYEDEPTGQLTFRPNFFYATLVFTVAAALLFINNRFTGINILLWVIAVLCLVVTFFPPVQWKEKIQNAIDRVKRVFTHGVNFRLTPWTALCLLVFGIVFFYRFYRLNEVPVDMISDHAEKLLDVYDVLNGAFSIFFIRNTGREAFQMYLSALMALVFGTGITFMTLKLGTAIMGLLTAVYMYFLGKEVGNRYVGLFAFLLCGIGYWPNVISRIGLRFTLYSAFTAPALFYFFRGIRRKKWTDLILAGIFTGIGLQGYSPFRVVPVLLVIGICLYLGHYWKAGHQKFALWGLVITGFAALILFLPLMRYILDQPMAFAFRALTRAGTVERPLPGPAWQIFLSNFWRASIMPFWDNGTIWVHSIPMRPALDVVGAAMYMLGLVAGILRYLRTRDWRILFLIIAVPFLMLPSIFSLAFPDENPCLNRTSGSLIPIFIIAAMGLDTLLHNIRRQISGKAGYAVPGLIGGLLVLTSLVQNYNLVFKEYDTNYSNNSLNTSEIGAVISDFVDIYGDPDSAYVVGFPYWVDTRLVGMNAGFPIKDYAIWPDGFGATLTNRRAKMFILHPEDTKSLDLLRQLYPDYYETVYKGRIEARNFIVFLVPAAVNSSEEVGIKAP